MYKNWSEFKPLFYPSCGFLMAFDVASVENLARRHSVAFCSGHRFLLCITSGHGHLC